MYIFFRWIGGFYPGFLLPFRSTCTLSQWRIQGRGPGGPAAPLFLDQTEARSRIFFLSQGLDDRASPYLKIWIRHRIDLSR